MRWAWHIARTGNYKFIKNLIGKPQGKGHVVHFGGWIGGKC